jgi:PAS domain S-box-containing protein
MKLTSRLLILLIIAVLLPMTIVSIVLITEHQRAYTAVILSQGQEIAGRLAHSIDNFVLDRRERLHLAGNAFLLQALAQADGDIFLTLLLNMHPDIHWVAVVDHTGHELARQARTGSTALMDTLEPPERDPWLEQALQGTPITSPVLFSSTNEPLVLLYLPILLGGEELVGVVMGEISLRRLWDQVLRPEVREENFAFVVAQDGTVIAHPDKSFIRQKHPFTEMPSVQAVLARQTGTTVYHDPVLQTSVAAAFTPLRVLSAGIIVGQPRTEIFAMRRALLTRMTITAIVCLLVALAVGGMFGYRLVQPILGLIGEVRTIRTQEGQVVQPMHANGGSEIDVLTQSFHDMTRELHARRDALVAAKAYTDNILASMTEMLFVLSPAGHIQTVNTAVRSLLGYTERELLGHSIGVISGSGWLIQRAAFEDPWRAGRGRNLETTFRTKDGRTMPVLLSGAVLRAFDGTTLGLVCVARDITERKQAEQALQEAHDRLESRVQERTAELLVSNTQLQQEITERQRAEEERQRLEAQLYQARKMEALGTLAGGIAHDFNNILAVILGYTELARFDLPGEARATQYLQEVLTAGKRAKHLVQQILTFSRKSDQQQKPVCLHVLIKETLTLLRAVLPATIHIQQRLSQDAGAILADPSQMHQVLLNLFSNAEHAMRTSGGVLEVQLDAVEIVPQWLVEHPELKPGPYVRLLVRDSGHGMEPEVLSRIFEPFFTTKDVGEGSGMGLAVVHGIITAHGGTISAQSTLGKGTTITIHLPRIGDTAGEEPSVPEGLPHGQGRLLLVDDEPVIVRWGQELLERLGYTVAAYTDSGKALKAFQNAPQRFDVVITDQTMPYLTGEKLVEEMKRLRPDIPIILCTGHSYIMDADKALAMGIAAFCMKPLVARELVDTIHRLLHPDEARCC